MKNYYQILNIKPTATDDEIKRSYRVLAKRYHPDVNPGDAGAASKFSDINEANSVLSDPKSRAEYDQKLKEAATPRPNPEDVIARQRAQAQAAARQAAAARQQAAFRNGMGGPSMARARAQAQAQFQSAQAQAQAQIQAIREQAFRAGREHGYTEGQAAAKAEKDKLNITIRELTLENKRLKKEADTVETLKRQLTAAEQDRRELEQELFNRDRELSQEKIRAKEMEDSLRELRDNDGNRKAAAQRSKAEINSLREKLDAALKSVKPLEKEIEGLKKANEELTETNTKLEQELKQSELTSKAQIQLQLDKRKQLQTESEELRKQLADITAEAEELRAEIEQWQQYAKSEEFISDTERKLEEWAKKTQIDRRMAKPTLYGALGVLIWATDEEIEAAHAKLVKRYTGKTEESVVQKLKRAEEAFAVLSDPQKRAEYNATINITPERIDAERKLIEDNKNLTEEYRNRIASKEFWSHYDELNAAALEGDVTAQYTLGELHYLGEEVDRDYEQAVFWFKEAAKQKHPDAMYYLGLCFVRGDGTDKNEDTGNGFIRQAAKLGSKLANQYLNAEEKKKTAENKRNAKKSGNQ